ncbi:tetratricopeptide repeat protein [Lentzea sp. NPDC058450]|uniref:caspase family protein n=1 Tax=Lentzea sp. NPDC058450 TaxID=3346505 RepID=UPI00364A4A10
MPGTRVVLLGTSKYADDRLPPIPVVAQCLDDLRRVLTDPDTGLVGPDDCTVVLDEPSMPTLGRRLAQGMAGADDLLVVYYVGHGIVGRRHDLYLGMPDSDPEDPTFGSLPYVSLRDRVLDSDAKTKIVVLDCCYSGRAMGEPMADPVTAVLGQLDIDGTYLLTSAQRDQVALVLPGEPHTAFTGRLLRVLEEGIPGGGEYLTIDDVYRRLSTVMSGGGLPRPQKRGTFTADRFRIALNRAHQVATEESLDQRFVAAVHRARATGYQHVLDDLRALLTAQRQLLGEHHVKCLRTRQHIALAEGASGNPAEALRLLDALLDHQISLGARDDEETLDTRQFIAVTLMALGRQAEALRVIRTLLPDRRRVLGPDHEGTARAQHVLARITAMCGETAEAVALLRELDSRLATEGLTAERVRQDLDLLTTTGVPDGR